VIGAFLITGAVLLLILSTGASWAAIELHKHLRMTIVRDRMRIEATVAALHEQVSQGDARLARGLVELEERLKAIEEQFQHRPLLVRQEDALPEHWRRDARVNMGENAAMAIAPVGFGANNAAVPTMDAAGGLGANRAVPWLADTLMARERTEQEQIVEWYPTTTQLVRPRAAASPVEVERTRRIELDGCQGSW